MATEESRRGLSVSPVLFSKSLSEERQLSSPSSVPSVTVSGKKVTVKSADMKENMQKEAINCAIMAFEKQGDGMEKDIAEYIKKEFDKNHGPTWHCIVGRNFGGQEDKMTIFRLGDVSVIIEPNIPLYVNPLKVLM